MGSSFAPLGMNHISTRRGIMLRNFVAIAKGTASLILDTKGAAGS